MPDDDDNVFGKDFGDNPGAVEEVDEPTEQLLPVSEFEKMIDRMNLDLHVRTEAVRFASQIANSANTDELITNAKKIEHYLIHGAE